MIKTFTCLVLCFTVYITNAQTPATTPTTQPFGKIDIADLEMIACDFEKDANAEVLFDQTNVYYRDYDLIIERHKRIKIFNDKGKRYADVRIPHSAQNLTNLQAETINLNGAAMEYTKVDKNQLFTEKLVKGVSATVFTFPNVKPGSVVEYKYTINTNIANYPNWYFQTSIPTRYSEMTALVSSIADYRTLEAVTMPYVINKEGKNNAMVRALANVPSMPDEPFTTTLEDNCQRIMFQLYSVKLPGQREIAIAKSWPKLGEKLGMHPLFGGQMNISFSGESELVKKAKLLKTDEQKIACLFNEVKKTLTWNDIHRFTADAGGIAPAWNKKSGNSAEINLILCRLLKKAGIKVIPMVVSTRDHGRINPTFPSPDQFNSMVAYVPVDSTRFYILDATNKYNVYNQVPINLLNSFGLYIDKDKEDYKLIFLENHDPVIQLVLITGNVTADGKINGSAEIDNYSYNSMNAVEKFKKDGQEEYLNYLTREDNNLKISSLTFENMDVDTMPLKTNVNFTLDLTSSDGNYIYFNPNILTSVRANPFLSTRRLTDIDFGYRDNYSIIGSYKIPLGYKVDVLPKSISLTTPDKSISFKRMVVEQDGNIVVRYIIDYKKSIYFKEDYPEFHEFTKKMYEMLNEQIVLKKT